MLGAMWMSSGVATGAAVCSLGTVPSAQSVLASTGMSSAGISSAGPASIVSGCCEGSAGTSSAGPASIAVCSSTEGSITVEAASMISSSVGPPPSTDATARMVLELICTSVPDWMPSCPGML
uniref:Putative secreted protein n=1 Tax=Ixodes ricinus TaxID=34613 RepID=A0A6B0UP00_IXORI